jgi:hypothetical protein
MRFCAGHLNPAGGIEPQRLAPFAALIYEECGFFGS